MYTATELCLVHVLLAFILFAISLLFIAAGLWVIVSAWGIPDSLVGLVIIGIGATFAGGGWMCVRCARKKECP